VKTHECKCPPLGFFRVSRSAPASWERGIAACIDTAHRRAVRAADAVWRESAAQAVAGALSCSRFGLARQFSLFTVSQNGHQLRSRTPPTAKHLTTCRRGAILAADLVPPC